jgi:hypothetical protein
VEENMTLISSVAQCERDAEHNRSNAEAAWRAAWWRTTVALAQPAPRSAEASAVLDEAQAILGQSRGYLSDRRGTGNVFGGDLYVDHIQRMAPRLAMVWAAAHAGQKADPSDINEIIAAEDEGVSLRDFAARFGQRFERPATPSARPTPDQIVEAVRSDPAAAEALAADPATREAVEEAGIRHRAEERPGTPADIATPEGRAGATERARRRAEDRLGDRTDEATNYLHGARNSLGHALYARDAWGITDPGAEADAVAAIERLLAMYKADVAGSDLTNEDRQFLESIGVTA